MRFWYSFFYFIRTYEVPNRTGSGLFFILWMFSYLNFVKVDICRLRFRFLRVHELGIVTVRMIFR
jgi:hypothetical protein